MKKILAIALAMIMVLSLCACTVTQAPPETQKPTEPPKTDTPATQAPETEPAGPAVATEISLWTYPIGKWGEQAVVDEMMADFEAATGIKVNVEYLTYADGDDKVNTAIEGGQAPDLIMEGPERLVANWGAKGKMVNVADLFDDTARANLIPSAMADCFVDDTTAYEYPLVTNAFCMAINKTVFEAADAMQYIDEATHTWTTENFLKAMDAVYKHTGKQVGAIFCGGQGGDQGTRVLVNNLYGGTFTNPEHTGYTWDSEENIKALKQLYDMESLEFDPSIVGADEIPLFYNGTLNVAFCWNAAQQVNPSSANTGSGKTANGDEIMFMAFPSQNGTDAKLGCQNYGFGIFDNGDESKVAAAKEFIKYFCAGEGAPKAVKATGNFPADTTITGVYVGDEAEDILNEYNATMVPLAGEYYQVTTGWAEARTAWWNLLQQVGASDGSVEAITEIVNTYVDQANGK